MDKYGFVEFLRKVGYGADMVNGIPTVFVTTPEEVKSVWKDVKLLATKIGYNHSFSVKRLEVSE